MLLGQKFIQNFWWRGLYLVTLFIINLLIARFLGPDQSGRLNLFINNLSLVVLIGGLNLESSLAFFSASHSISSQRLRTVGFIIPVAATGIYLLVTRTTHLAATGYTVQQTVWMGGIYLLGVLLNTFFGALFNAVQDFRTSNVILTLCNLLFIAWLLWSAPYWGRETSGDTLTAVYFFLFLLQGVLNMVFYFSRTGAGRLMLPQKEEWKKLVSYATLVLLTNIVFFLVYRVDYWFVDYYTNSAALGNYIQVSKLGQLFMTVPVMMAAVIFPVTARGEEGRGIEDVLPVISRLLFSVYAVIIVLLALSGKFLFPLLYGRGFGDMFIAFAFLAPGIVALSVQALLTAFYAGKNKVIYNLQGASLALVVIIAGDFLLIPRWGIAGAAQASTLGYVTYMFYMCRRFRREYRIPLQDFFRLRWADWVWVKQEFINRGGGKL